MSETIWKFHLPILDKFFLDMPEGAHLLKAEAQSGEAMLWAQVNPDLPTERRYFALCGTGHPLPASYCVHVSTFQMPPFVWHLFEFVTPP